MTVKELKDFIFENYYRQIGFTKEKSYYSNKRQKKIFTVICNQIKGKKHLILVISTNTINLI